MKIIDQTPYYDENGELSFVNRSKAAMQYGLGWFKEMEAQTSIVAIFDKVLDKSYTLLRNVAPPGLDATIPFILVGPTGVYVMYVTPLKGMYRAKGDEWGTVMGGSYKPEKPNLLTRTEKMARAIQVFLQRQGFIELSNVEPVLLCSDPSVTVDSLRPIIRVVMSDALERLAVSISQSRLVLSPETAYNIVKHILKPAADSPAEPEETTSQVETPTVSTEADLNPYVPDFALPDSESPQAGTANPPIMSTPAGTDAGTANKLKRRRAGLNRKQWAFLAILLIIWLVIIAVFIFMVSQTLLF